MAIVHSGRMAVYSAAILAACLFTGLPAQAHSPADPSAVGDVGKLMAASNFVFHGKVKSVTYRNSKLGSSGAVPFTFVTYRVNETLFGNPRSEITLRFIGGANGRGGFVSVEGVPAFSLGDEDILFVSGNGEAGCALALCEFGRYRVYKGAMYEAHGAPVLSFTADHIVTGGAGPDELMTVTYPAPSFDEVIKNAGAMEQLKTLHMTVEQARARYNAQAPKFMEARVVHGGAAGKMAVKTGLSLGSMLASLKTSASSKLTRATAVIANADVNAPISAIELQAASPPQ